MRLRALRRRCRGYFSFAKRGIKALADEVHAAGLHLGLYSDYGVQTCAGYPGSLGHYEQDAATYAPLGAFDKTVAGGKLAGFRPMTVEWVSAFGNRSVQTCKKATCDPSY